MSYASQCRHGRFHTWTSRITVHQIAALSLLLALTDDAQGVNRDGKQPAKCIQNAVSLMKTAIRRSMQTASKGKMIISLTAARCFKSAKQIAELPKPRMDPGFLLCQPTMSGRTRLRT